MRADVNNGVEGLGGIFKLLDDEAVMNNFFFAWGEGYGAVNLMFLAVVKDFPLDPFFGPKLEDRYLMLNLPQYYITFSVM